MSDTSADNIVNEAQFGDYFALLKPRVMTLVVFTAFVGLLAAPVSVHPFVGFTAILFIALGGGASGALNMWYDADIDAIMRRTQNGRSPRAKSPRMRPKRWASRCPVCRFLCLVSRRIGSLPRS